MAFARLRLEQLETRECPAVNPIPDAAELYRAMHGGLTGLGTDEDAIYRIIEGKTGPEIQQLRDAYNAHYGRNLDADLRSELDDDEFARVSPYLNLPTGPDTSAATNQAALAAKHQAAAAALRQAMAGLMTDEDTIYRVLGDQTLDPAALRAEYQRQFPGRDLDVDLRDDLDDDEYARAQALLQRNPNKIAAAELRQAMAGIGTDEATVYRVLANPNLDLSILRTEYQALTQRTLDQDLRDDLDDTELSRANALLARDQLTADAIALHEAMAGPMTDEEAVWRVLDGKEPGYLRELELRYNALYQSEQRTLRGDIESDFGGMELRRTLTLLEHGRLTDAQKLYYALNGWLGLGTDEQVVRQVLANKKKADIDTIIAEYANEFQRDLRADLEYDLSGREEFEALIALEGIPVTPELALDQLRRWNEYERQGWTNWGAALTVNWMTSADNRFDNSYAAANAYYLEAMSDGQLSPEEKAELDRRLAWANADLKNYQDTRDSAARTAGTVLATAASVTVVIFTVGAGAPLVILYAAGAGGVTQVLGRTIVSGGTQGWQELPSDFLEGAITGGTAGLFPGAGTTATTTVGAVTKGALRGFYVGGVSGFTAGTLMQALDEHNWDHGFIQGLWQALQAGGASGALGAMTGAGAGAFFSLLGRVRASSPQAADDLLQAALLDGGSSVQVLAHEAAARAHLTGKLASDDLAQAIELARGQRWDELRSLLTAKGVAGADDLVGRIVVSADAVLLPGGSARLEEYRARLLALGMEFDDVGLKQLHATTCVPTAIQSILGTAEGLESMFLIAAQRGGYTLESAVRYLLNLNRAGVRYLAAGTFTLEEMAAAIQSGRRFVLNVQGSTVVENEVTKVGAHAVGVIGWDAATSRFLIHDPLTGTRYWMHIDSVRQRLHPDPQYHDAIQFD
jgi:hypothetical protein